MHLYPSALHMHTSHSDGTGTVQDLARAARQAGLRWIIVTDHDTLAGQPLDTDHMAFRAVGFYDFGGALNITNYYGFYQDSAATTPGGAITITNPWGIHIADSRADNWFKKSLVIGGSTGKTTDVGYALEVGDKKAFKFTPMTIAERDAAFPTPAEGTMVAISDGATKGLQYHDGTNWLGM